MSQESENTAPISLLATLDENYIPHLNVMLYSLLQSNPGEHFHIYLLHGGIREEALDRTRRLLGEENTLFPIKVDGSGLNRAPTTSRYPQEIYFRIFAAKYLPQDLNRVIYLDPDVIVNGPLRELYSTPMEHYYFAAASHIDGLLRLANGLRLDMEKESPYINSGVMLMNLDRLRKEQRYEDVYAFIREKKNLLFLPDQDIISSLYGTKICVLDPFLYNMTERLYIRHAPFEKDFDVNWVRKNTVIIHYCGRNKPWKSGYMGYLGSFYTEAAANLDRTVP